MEQTIEELMESKLTDEQLTQQLINRVVGLVGDKLEDEVVLRFVAKVKERLKDKKVKDKRIKVYLTDDHEIITDPWRTKLNQTGIFEVIGVSHTINECRDELRKQSLENKQRPDVLVLDLHIELSPNDREKGFHGVDFCKEMRSAYPQMQIVILSMHSDWNIVDSTLENGASGYVLKDCVWDELMAAIMTTFTGGKYMCTKIHPPIITKSSAFTDNTLTLNEQAVLDLFAQGYDAGAIATALKASEDSVNSHLKVIRKKLGIVKEITGEKIPPVKVVLLAKELGWLTIDDKQTI